MEWYFWVAAAIIALAVFGFCAWRLYKATPDKRKELVVNWLKGVVDIAENIYEERGKGAEKMAMAIEYFNEYAPEIYKWIVKNDKLDLKQLIELALTYMKENVWKA